MASEIIPIPVLIGKVAERFVQKAEKTAIESRATIDFSEHIRIARQILHKAKLKKNHDK